MMKKKILPLAGALLCWGTALRAQSDDFGLWTEKTVLAGRSVWDTRPPNL